MKKYISLISLAVVIMASCQKEAVQPEGSQTPEQELVTIYASLEDVKSAVNTSTGDFSWALGEGISVAPTSGTSYYTFNCSIPESGAFEGTETPGNIAVSPAQTGTFTSDTEFQVSFPASYTWADGVTNALMVGTKVDDTYKYQFKHAGALLVVTYENVPANTSALRVVSTTAGQKLTGTVTLAGSAVGDIEIANDNEALTGNQVDINFEKTTGNVASRTFYVPVPTGHYDAITFSLVNDDADITASTVKTLKNANLARTDVVVFPTITLKEGFTPETVGNIDNTSAWGDAWSNLYTIEKGQILHLEFENYGSKVNSWNNWVLFVTNNVLYNADASIRETQGYSEYFVLRADSYGWGANYTTNRLSSNYKWDSFKDDLYGATIHMTIEYTALGSILVKTKVNDGTYWENYTHPVSLNDGAIGAFLWCDNSHYVIKKAWYTNSKKTSITGIKSAYNYYIYDTALELDTIGWPKDVVAVYNDGDEAGILPSEITFPVDQSLADSAGNQEYTATYIGNYYSFTIPVIMGTEAFGSTTLTTSEKKYSPFFGDVSAGNHVSKTMFVYSSCANNWSSPCADLASAGFKVIYASVRMDNWGWGDNYSSATLTSDWDWAVFTAMQNHDKVKITWTNDTSTATCRFDATYWDGATHFQQFAGITISNSELAYRAFTENSYVVVID